MRHLKKPLSFALAVFAMLSLMAIGGYLSLSGGRLSGALYGPYAEFGAIDGGIISCGAGKALCTAGGVCSPASATQSGCVTTGTQTLAGLKTFLASEWDFNSPDSGLTMSLSTNPSGVASWLTFIESNPSSGSEFLVQEGFQQFYANAFANTGVEFNDAGIFPIVTDSMIVGGLGGVFTSGLQKQFLSMQARKFTASLADGGIAVAVSGNGVIQLGRTSASTLPTCNSGLEGVILYDSTNETPKICFLGGGAGLEWMNLKTQGIFNLYQPRTVNGAFGLGSANIDYQVRMHGIIWNVSNPGVGAGTVTVTLKDGSANTICTGTVTCTGAVGTAQSIACTATTVGTAGSLVVNWDSSACTTSPTGNISVTYY